MTALTVDASDVALGGELSQKDRFGTWRPIAFFSRRLQGAERKYSAFDRELFAIYAAIKHFRHFREGRVFTVFTDHKPLTFALKCSTDRSPRQTRQLSFIAGFTGDIQHVQGSSKVVTDALSRPSLPPTMPQINATDQPQVDFLLMASEQQGMAQQLQDSSCSGTEWSFCGILRLGGVFVATGYYGTIYGTYLYNARNL